MGVGGGANHCYFCTRAHASFYLPACSAWAPTCGDGGSASKPQPCTPYTSLVRTSSTTIMSASTVHVKNISSATSEKEIKDFFSFCGKISSIEVTKSGESQNATVTFEKETAAKTALLLDNTQLGATQVQVSSAIGSNDDDGSHFTQNTERDSDEITQEEKPRARIAAEYIAHGYVLGDQAIQKAIDLDTKHGVSNRFLST